METWIWKELTRQTGVGKISDGGNSICESKDTTEKKIKDTTEQNIWVLGNMGHVYLVNQVISAESREELR